MRLIDADKLREKLIIDYEVRETYFGEILLKEIDESPTVENITVFCENADEKTTEDLKAELQSAIEARPQGEWIKWSFKTFGALGDWEYKCSNCEKVYGGEYNFCPNCGADMRKGSVDNNSCCNCYWNCSGTCKNEQSGYYKMSIKSVMGIPPYKHCSKYEAYEGDG